MKREEEDVRVQQVIDMEQGAFVQSVTGSGSVFLPKFNYYVIPLCFNNILRAFCLISTKPDNIKHSAFHHCATNVVVQSKASLSLHSYTDDMMLLIIAVGSILCQ